MKFIVDLTQSDDNKPSNIIKLSDTLYIEKLEHYFTLSDSPIESQDFFFELTKEDILLLEQGIKAMRQLGWIK